MGGRNGTMESGFVVIGVACAVFRFLKKRAQFKQVGS
jgi:hypothetical protein